MGIKLLHQCGHCTNWNTQAFSGGSGDGLILSPVHRTKIQMERMSSEEKTPSLFDPQFYLPRSQKKKLTTYEFFPETISSGFNTIDFHSLALSAAQACVRFQIEQDYAGIVIPVRYIDQLFSDYTESQDAYSVHPFLQAIEESKTEKPIYLTMVLTSHMLQDAGFRTKLLNWATSFPKISGIYLIPVIERSRKQIDSAQDLSALIETIKEMKSIDLDVIVGYVNTENVLLTLIDDITLTIGSFENTRMFSIDKFIQLNEPRKGPKARIYLPGLLNWIQFENAKQIRDVAPKVWSKIYHATEQSEKALAAPVEPTFNQSGLYLHYFYNSSNQLGSLASLSTSERLKSIKSQVADAKSYYSQIAASGIQLEKHGTGEHLDAWETILGNWT